MPDTDHRMCDSCRHDLEALSEQHKEAETRAVEHFKRAIYLRAQIDDKLDEACDCIG